MTVHHIDDIVRDVRVALDQNGASQQLALMYDEETLGLNEAVRAAVVDAVKSVHAGAPAHLLDGGHDFCDGLYWKEMESGWVLLPEDFMRLVVFQMDDWARPVYHAIGTDDAEYARQSSPFKGIRGTAQKPVCAIGIRPEGRVLEFYSCRSEEAKVSRAVYLPYPKLDAYDCIEICSRVYPAVVYATASIVLTTFGDADKATAFSELAKSVLV